MSCAVERSPYSPLLLHLLLLFFLSFPQGNLLLPLPLLSANGAAISQPQPQGLGQD